MSIRDLIELVASYPLWVKIVAAMLQFSVVVLLIVCKPASMEQTTKADHPRNSMRDASIDPNTCKTALFTRTKTRVDRMTDHLIKEKVNPWLFMFPGSKVTITLHDGHAYSYAGLEFAHSVSDVFWKSFIDPFVEDALQQILDDVGKECQSNGIDPCAPLDEAASLLDSMINRVYRTMADVDQRLRGKGSPKRVQKRNVQEYIDRMGEKLKGHLQAAKALYSNTRT